MKIPRLPGFIKIPLRFAVIVWLLANAPLLMVSFLHFPQFDRTFLALLGTVPGQYFYLLLVFPFIALSAGLAYDKLHSFLEQTVAGAEGAEPAFLTISTSFLNKGWLVRGVALFFGAGFAAADFLGSSRVLDELEPQRARTAVAANEIILSSVEKTNSEIILEQLRQHQSEYPSLELDLERIGSFREQTGEVVDDNRLMIRETAIQAERSLQRQPSQISTILDRAERALNLRGEASPGDVHLLDAIVFFQIVLNESLHPPAGAAESLMKISNAVELTAVVYTGFYIAVAAVILLGLRLGEVYKGNDIPRQPREVAALAAFSTLLLAFWPALRGYSINEMQILYPQSTTIHGPIGVFIFCLFVFLYLVVAFLRGQWFTVGPLGLGFLLSLVSVGISLQHFFLIRNSVGAGATIGNLLLVLLISLAVLGSFSIFLLLTAGRGGE